MDMESSTPKHIYDGAKQPSCWDCLKMKLHPWRNKFSKVSHHNDTTRQRSVGCNMTAAIMSRTKHPKPGGGAGFRYDPISYSQNFDDGSLDDDNEDTSYRGFSSRYAAPPSKSLGAKTCPQEPGLAD